MILLDRIENSNMGASLFGLNVSCPTQADDIALVNPTGSDLQQMLNICEEYTSSRKCRFTFSPSKSKIVTFSKMVEIITSFALQIPH